MTVTVEQVLEEALCLSDEGRVALAERLIESVAPDQEALKEQLALALDRDHDMELGLVAGVPGNEALRTVRVAIAKLSEA
jgi:hypothetical protein